MLIYCVCEKSLEPEPEKESAHPIADAGPDQICDVGSYINLDVSNSTPGGGDLNTYYRWIQDENNPSKVYNLGYWGEDYNNRNIGFIKEGIYKFTLMVSNDLQVSDSDQVIITVNPRENTVFEDPAMEIHVRFALKIPEG